MELSGQIKKYRDQLGLSQEELAEKIFVTRQSISNWENDKTYPDLQSLLRLSELFGLSLDELIKGDIETMKDEINKLEIKKMNRWGNLLAILFLALVILPVPLLKILDTDTVGFLLVMAPLFVISMAVALRVEKLKKDNDVHTYKEIVAFCEQAAGRAGQGRGEGQAALPGVYSGHKCRPHRPFGSRRYYPHVYGLRLFDEGLRKRSRPALGRLRFHTHSVV